jgi:hypothetical protein
VLLNHPSESWALYDHDHIVAFLQQIGMQDIGVKSFYGYPPQFAAVFSWLAFWDVSTARTIWSFMSIAFFLVACALTLSISYRGDNRGVYLLLAAIALLCRPTVDEIYWGQSNALLFLMLAATFFFLERGNRYTAGLFLAMAISFKVVPLAVAGLMLCRREWRVLISTSVFSLLLAAYTALHTGWSVIIRYFVSDLARLNNQFALIGGAPFNSSVKGALQTYSGSFGAPMSPAAIGIVSSLFGLAVCLLACYLIARRNKDTRIDYALATATMLLASPALESVHMVVVLIPLLILVGTSLEQPQAGSKSALGPRGELVLGALAITLLMFSPRFVTYTMAILLVYALCVARYWDCFKVASAERWN